MVLDRAVRLIPRSPCEWDGGVEQAGLVELHCIRETVTVLRGEGRYSTPLVLLDILTRMFCPTPGRLDVMGMPNLPSVAAFPMPESMRSLGVLNYSTCKSCISQSGIGSHEDRGILPFQQR